MPAVAQSSAALAEVAPDRSRAPLAHRPRLALMAVLLAAAMPTRISDSLPLIHSVSILDILLIAAAITLFLDLAHRPLDPGYRAVFRILCVPVVISVASLAWSQNRSQTLHALIIYGEGLVAYLFAIRELGGLPASRVISYLARYAILLIIPGVLLLLHVPGFGPEVPSNLSHTSGDYLSYYSRFSHPVLGRSNNIAAVLAFFPAILIYWGHTRASRSATLAGMATALAIFLTLSRGTLLAFAIAGLFYAVLPRASAERAPEWSRKILTVLAAGVIGIAILYTINPATHDFFAGRFGTANISGRANLVSLAIPKLGDRPFLGYGAGVTPDGDLNLAEGVHDTYLQQALYFGLPLALVVSVALWAIAAFFLGRRRPTPIAGVIGYTLMVELVSFVFESTLEGTVLRVLFYLSIGLVVGLLRSVESDARQEPTACAEA